MKFWKRKCLCWAMVLGLVLQQAPIAYGMILDDENHLNRRTILQSPFQSDPEDEDDSHFFMIVDAEDYYEDKNNAEPFPPSKTGSLIKAIEFHRANNLPLSAYLTVELYNMFDQEDNDLQRKYKKRKIGPDLSFEDVDDGLLLTNIQGVPSEFPEGPLALFPPEIQEYIFSFFDQSSFLQMNQKVFEDQLDIIQGEQWNNLCLAGQNFKHSCVKKNVAGSPLIFP